MLISKNLAIAMINSDLSGLRTEEIEKIKNFPDFEVVEWNEDYHDINGICRISGLWDNCVEIEVKEQK